MSLESKLYVVSVHIGNPDDITLRALKILKEVDFVICEEYKSGSRILHQYGIKKPLEQLNEHNEKSQTPELLRRLQTTEERAALISDAGSPIFADPGSHLVWQCHQSNVSVRVVPGPSSLIAALMSSGLECKKFLYYGFLSAKREERIKELEKLPKHLDIIFLEAPYRLPALMTDFIRVLGKNRQAVIAYRLTQPEEQVFWGNLEELAIMTKGLPKGEFVFILKKFKPPKRYQRRR